LVYWVSVQVYPRYLFMHLPLLFTSLLYLFFQKSRPRRHKNIIDIVLGVLCFGLLLAMFAPLILERKSEVDFLLLKVLSLSSLIAVLCWLFLKKKQERLLITIAVLLVARIGLNWFILPERNVIDWGTPVKESSIKIGKEFKGKPLFIFSKTLMQPTNAFYLTRERADNVRAKD